jgi:hypothetical protein
MFFIKNITLPTGHTATLHQTAPTPKDMTIGDVMGSQGSAYILTVDNMGTIDFLDTGDTISGPGTWSVRVNNGPVWFYDAGGDMDITVDSAGNVTISGVEFGRNTIQTKIGPLRASTPLDTVSTGDYDMVVAVTQVAINETLGEYLAKQHEQFAIYAIADGNGAITELTTDPSKANCYLKGKITLEKDSNGKYINLVNLNTAKGNQTVQYNVTIQGGEFHFNAAGLVYDKKQDGSTPWVFRLFVNLSMQDVAKSSLPPEVQKELQNVDENIFSIQQLYLDLNTAALASIDGVVFPSLVMAPAAQILSLYMAQQQATNKPLFGVSVHFKQQNVPPPTLAPTYVDFCVTPYLDANGNHANPDLDTLNYLVMFDHHPAPAYRPQSFKNNWVVDPKIQGAMAIKKDPVLDFLRNNLAPLLQLLCPIMNCKADGHKAPPNDVLIQLNPGAAHPFNVTFDGSSGLFGSYSYNTHDESEDIGGTYYLKVNGAYSSNCNLYALHNTIMATGSMMASAETTVRFTSSGAITTTMPDTTFNWSVELELYFDPSHNGQLNLKVINPNFKDNPLIADHDEAWWEKFIRALSGSMKTYTDSLGDLRANVATNIEGTIQTNLNNIFATTNHFILPGGKTFAFKDPQFTNNKDLSSNITYLNPNG